MSFSGGFTGGDGVVSSPVEVEKWLFVEERVETEGVFGLRVKVRFG